MIYTKREIATMPAAELLRLNKAIGIALFESPGRSAWLVPMVRGFIDEIYSIH